MIKIIQEHAQLQNKWYAENIRGVNNILKAFPIKCIAFICLGH